MIKHKTVLILGAGASLPYKFLTTEDLRKRILQLAKIINVRDANELGIELNHVLEFREAFQYSGTYSIDEFLGKRKEYTEVGKLLIAKSLLEYENINDLFSLESPRDWYKYLVQSLTEGVPLEDLNALNTITIVTFNYDRSLEQYLFLALKNQYGAKDDEVAKNLSKIDIIHIHGQLGYLPWQLSQDSSLKVDYINGTAPEKVIKAAKGLKIIYETNNNSPELERAISSIENAERVFFLGFGYHPLNLKRLRLNGIKGGRLVLGTAFEMGSIQIEKAIVDSNLTLHKHELFQDCDIIKFFKEKVSLV